MNRALKQAALFATLVITAFMSRSAGLSERSVYQLDSSWTEDNGRVVELRKLAGNVQVLTLMFTTCTGSCPVTVKALQMFARTLGADIKEHTRFLLVTVDPRRDTLAALRQYRQEMKLDAKRWKLLRGAESDVRELAAVLGFNYEQIDSGQFVHSNLITVLDTHGEIAHQQTGVTGSEAELTAAISRALSADGGAAH
jgi:protein SCO1/2